MHLSNKCLGDWNQWVGGPIGVLNMKKPFFKYPWVGVDYENENQILNCSSKDECITLVYVNKYVHTFSGFAQNFIFLSHQKLECV
jgi:hypothetical protein